MSMFLLSACNVLYVAHSISRVESASFINVCANFNTAHQNMFPAGERTIRLELPNADHSGLALLTGSVLAVCIHWHSPYIS